MVWPPSFGSQKKMAKMTMLTMISRNTAAIRRRTMNVTTARGAGARLAYQPGTRALTCFPSVSMGRSYFVPSTP